MAKLSKEHTIKLVESIITKGSKFLHLEPGYILAFCTVIIAETGERKKRLLPRK